MAPFAAQSRPSEQVSTMEYAVACLERPSLNQTQDLRVDVAHGQLDAALVAILALSAGKVLGATASLNIHMGKHRVESGSTFLALLVQPTGITPATK